MASRDIIHHIGTRIEALVNRLGFKTQRAIARGLGILWEPGTLVSPDITTERAVRDLASSRQTRGVFGSHAIGRSTTTRTSRSAHDRICDGTRPPEKAHSESQALAVRLIRSSSCSGSQEPFPEDRVDDKDGGLTHVTGQTPRAKPLLVAALICERILQEVDGSVSIMRIGETLSFTGDPAKVQAVPVRCWAFVSFRAGQETGRYTIVLRVRSDAGTILQTSSPVSMDLSRERGASLPVEIARTFETAGLYWIDVLVDGDLTVSMPLRITVTRPPANGGAR